MRKKVVKVNKTKAPIAQKETFDDSDSDCELCEEELRTSMKNSSKIKEKKKKSTHLSMDSFKYDI